MHCFPRNAKHFMSAQLSLEALWSEWHAPDVNPVNKLLNDSCLLGKTLAHACHSLHKRIL